MKERKTIITDAQRRSDALPAAFLPSGTFFFFFSPGPDAEERIHPDAGQVER